MRHIAPFIPFIIVCVIGFIGLLSTAIKEDRKQREAERRRSEKDGQSKSYDLQNRAVFHTVIRISLPQDSFWAP